ncbi:hypothetical protein [Brachybacterium paraconglomeratum]|uniref:hypothetical protein n=1 Tax=Brachybacterium paraconglomeratum TaxID=173362 RepID=UPI003F7B6B6D
MTAPGSPAPAAAPSSPSLRFAHLPAPLPQLVREGLAALPERTEALRTPEVRHRALGRLVRDVVLGGWVAGPAGPPRAELALEALGQLKELQSAGGTFRSGDNVDSPPDSAFTLNDLAWARRAIEAEGLAHLPEPQVAAGPRTDGPARESAGLGALLQPLDDLLERSTPALVTGGVHTPNHRWEISAALVRLWELTGVEACRERAEQWLAEGVDLQPDGMFSERSANYAAHVSIPSLLTLARVLEREDLREAADRGTLAQAALTGPDGMIETLASRRQDQGAPFDGGAMLSVLHAHAARTGDPLSARAARRVLPRADEQAALALLALGLEDSSALGPLPAAEADPTTEEPEVHEFADSGLAVVDHGRTRVVIHGGTDTPALGRVTSGAASNPTLLRLLGRELRVEDVRLSRDFFSLGPLRPTSPRRRADSGGGIVHEMSETVSGQYFHPLPPRARRFSGDYQLGFNGRFASAMSFPERPTDEVRLNTDVTVETEAGGVRARFTFDGPPTAHCLLLTVHGDAAPVAETPASDTREPNDSTTPARGGRILVLRPEHAGEGHASLTIGSASGHERLTLTARGELGGREFYAPGEALTFLGGTDAPKSACTWVMIPAHSSSPIEVSLQIT